MESMSPQQTKRAARAGWSSGEDALLFERAAAAQAAGRPLKAVFDDVARQTGRRPNSVRNYYYARVKQGGGCRHAPAFVPFTEPETRALLEAVLAAQAAGESVRACTLRLGGGDQSAMLRYQNKYRSLVRGKPALVRSVLEDMAGRGVPAFDPYAAGTARRSGRPRRREQPLERAAADVVERLGQVEGLDVQALLKALGTLALRAVQGAPAGGADGAEALGRQLARQRERCDALCAALRTLVRVNAEFLHQAAVVRTGDLSDYLRALEDSLRPCERLLAE